ncbi:hypothetical protein BLS_008778 [Venturia inaequalis]|uniref:Uncharacterized protein n=1 Tax=Venturia inaequalis TaxID=5025 RepID=A0A8H3U6U3_VENIN|nr:hypothetical protein BLS_008778 [Venturia inaequalis]
MSPREYNIVVLGSGGVGKSCLTGTFLPTLPTRRNVPRLQQSYSTENAEAQFVQNIWIESYDPTIEDSYRKTLEVDGRQVVLEILDTAGTEQFTAMRELYMKTGQGFLLVFSITSLSSLHELAELREQIIRIKDDPLIPIVLVGNKCDLEEDRAVSRARAFSVSQSWGNAPYYETSARRRANVDECFRDLCRQIIRRDQEALKAQGHRPDEGEAGDKRHNREHRKRRKKSKRRDACTIL